MRNIRQYFAAAWILAALAGCANNATVKMPADLAQPNKKTTVVAIAAPYPAEVGFSEEASFFGALGALADSIGGQGYRDQLARKMSSLLGSWKAEDMLRDKFERQLAAKGYQIVGGKDIQPLPAAVAYDPQKGMGDIDAMSRAVTA